MDKNQDTSSVQTLRHSAAVFACLFFAAGGDGQAGVQMSFLLLTAGCLLLAQWRSRAVKAEGQSQTNWGLHRELQLLAGRWHGGW